MSKFTSKQIKDWRAYERVRLSGRYNMFDPNAKSAAGLDREEYMFCLKNYDELRKSAGRKINCALTRLGAG